MLAELLARSGRSVLRGVPPDGRSYWSGRFWDREAAARSPLLAGALARQRDTIFGYLSQHGAQVQRVLEFACGTGEFTVGAAALTAAKEIVALDISPLALRIARARIDDPRLTLVQADFWADHDLGTADVVLCVDAIHHLGDVRRVLERLRSFATPAGVVIGNVWTADHFHELQRERYGAVRHGLGTAAFFATALLVRLSAGHLRTRAYRTQLLDQRDVGSALRATFGEVRALRVDRYFTSFVCAP